MKRGEMLVGTLSVPKIYRN